MPISQVALVKQYTMLQKGFDTGGPGSHPNLAI